MNLYLPNYFQNTHQIEGLLWSLYEPTHLEVKISIIRRWWRRRMTENICRDTERERLEREIKIEREERYKERDR